ncbi:MAG: hypothetical protein GY859_37355 [Desulfobacterales bacterium]|nr:hypothetical protein [Desulfobacterales bacterium]
MTDIEQTDDVVSGAIEDYLLSLAESLQHAQRQLGLMKLPAQPGRAAITYQIPRLDFEFKMSLEIAKGQAPPGQGAGPGNPAGGLFLRARPAGGGADAGRASVEAASTIKGSFVAVPSEGGKPPPIVQTFLHRKSSRQLEITVDVGTAAGEKISGVEVQFNIDRALSEKLNEPGVRLNENTDLWYGIVRTGADGRALNNLRVSEKEAWGAHVAVVVDVLGDTDTVIFKVEKDE